MQAEVHRSPTCKFQLSVALFQQVFTRRCISRCVHFLKTSGEASKCWLFCFRNFAQGRLIDGQSDVQMAGHWILRLVSRKTLKSGQGFPSLCALRQVCVHLNARLGAVHGASMTSVCWHLSEGIQSKDCFPEGLCKRSQSLSTMYDEHAQNQLCPLQ